MIGGIQSFTLKNFEIPLGSLKSFPSDNIVYIEINFTISPNEGALSNLLVFWINIPINIAASCSNILGSIRYTKVIKSLLIISVTLSEIYFSSFNVTNTCFNNTTILAV